MERERFEELKANLDRLMEDGSLAGRDVCMFAHCHATMELADELLKRGIRPKVILDNNPDKYGIDYKGIPVCGPKTILKEDNAIVLIVSRFYEQMRAKLKEIGFAGRIEKVVDYNSFTEYSLSPDTLIRKSERVKRGIKRLEEIKEKYLGRFIVFCPFAAMGDVYFCMSYLKSYLDLHGYGGCVVCVVGEAQRQVAELFGYAAVMILSQQDMDEALQAVIKTDDKDCFIAHQDRPYVVKLHKALYRKCIPLETIYKCGIFGLPQDTKPVEPSEWVRYDFGEVHLAGNEKCAILSPYAKSVASLPQEMWADMVSDLTERGYTLYTNVAGEERPLPGTEVISPQIGELRSAVEQAGLFIGIRSGICDVIRTAKCRKIALYPDYFYCDTKWKSIDMYSINGFENIVVGDDDTWEKVKKEINL